MVKIRPDKIGFGEERFRQFLVDQFAARMKKNRRYSLRAFARSLDIHPSTFSRILSGQRAISVKTFYRIAHKLQLTSEQISRFLQEFEEESIQSIEADAFANIADWYHAAILECAYVEGFEITPEAVSIFLDIDLQVAQKAITRLERLGLLREVNGKYMKVNYFLSNLSTVNTSAAHKEFQRQIVAKALDAIDSVPQEAKDITSMTFAIDEARLPELKEAIKTFRRRLALQFGSKSANRVYNLSIQLCPTSISSHAVQIKKKTEPPRSAI